MFTEQEAISTIAWLFKAAEHALANRNMDGHKILLTSMSIVPNPTFPNGHRVELVEGDVCWKGVFDVCGSPNYSVEVFLIVNKTDDEDIIPGNFIAFALLGGDNSIHSGCFTKNTTTL